VEGWRREGKQVMVVLMVMDRGFPFLEWGCAYGWRAGVERLMIPSFFSDLVRDHPLSCAKCPSWLATQHGVQA
jgi:hypothetical protein